MPTRQPRSCTGSSTSLACTETPAFLVDEVKIEGRWIRGPVLVNQYGHYHTEAVALGIEPVPGDDRATYRAAIARATELLKDGKFPTAACQEVPAADGALQAGDPGRRRDRPHEVRLHPVEPRRRGPLCQHGLGLHPGPAGRRQLRHLSLPAHGPTPARREPGAGPERVADADEDAGARREGREGLHRAGPGSHDVGPLDLEDRHGQPGRAPAGERLAGPAAAPW